MKRSRSVYSTETGSKAKGRCDKCGWPKKNCQCSGQSEELVPDRVLAKLRMETSGRRGKAVTVIYDLPKNAEFLKALGQELRKLCGTGGSVRADSVELQGDHRDKVRQHLQAKGWATKG